MVLKAVPGSVKLFTKGYEALSSEPGEASKAMERFLDCFSPDLCPGDLEISGIGAHS